MDSNSNLIKLCVGDWHTRKEVVVSEELSIVQIFNKYGYALTEREYPYKIIFASPKTDIIDFLRTDEDLSLPLCELIKKHHINVNRDSISYLLISWMPEEV